MKIPVLYRSEGAAQASGLVAFLDIFGDFTKAAYLIGANADKVVFCENASEATEYCEAHPQAILLSDNSGNGDESNSLVAFTNTDFSGKTAVLLGAEAFSCIKAVMNADEIIAGGLVNGKAVASYIQQKNPEVSSLVCAGSEDIQKTDADNLCSKYVKGIVERNPLRNLHHMIAQLKYTDGAKYFSPSLQPIISQDDFFLRTAHDKFDFVLRVSHDAEFEAVCLERQDVSYVEEPVIPTKVNPGDMLSQFSRQEVLDLPWDIKGALAYGNYVEAGGNFDVAMILGANPTVMESRSAAAAKLYHEGRCKLFIPTGGVKWETEFGYISECDVIASYLVKMGVPKELILCEAQADTTRTNMQFVSKLLNQRMDITKARIAVVTSYYHVRRSVLLAQHYIPGAMHFGIKAEFPGDDPEHFQQDPRLLAGISMECLCMWNNIKQGLCPDMAVL